VTGEDLADDEFDACDESDDACDGMFAAFAAECRTAFRMEGALARWPGGVEGVEMRRYASRIAFDGVGHDALPTEVALANALRRVRRMVELYSAWLSFNAGEPVAVFCLADSRSGAYCGRPAAHDGEHVEPGPDGERWSDERVGAVA
jgi:hypothetical protein